MPLPFLLSLFARKYSRLQSAKEVMSQVTFCLCALRKCQSPVSVSLCVSDRICHNLSHLPLQICVGIYMGMFVMMCGVHT